MSRVTPTQPTTASTVLAIVDRSFLIVVPLLVISVTLWSPALTGLWTLIGLATIFVIGGFALLGQSGRAPWRGELYALITLAAAIGALWTIGPITGVGVMFGLSVACAGAFLSVRGLVAVVAIAILAIGIRTLIGGAGGMPLVDERYTLELAQWIGVGIASLLLLGVTRRMLGALFGWLEQSYASASEAYEREMRTRQELESSRQQLEELARVELVGRLAGGVAHDVNNALAAIMAAADVLASEVATPDQRRRLAELESASHFAADLVRDLLWTGRRFPTSTSAVANLDAVTRICLERLGRVARKITVDVRIDPAIDLAVSAEHLEQILFGLVVGADRCGVTRLALTATPIPTTIAPSRVAIGFASVAGGQPLRVGSRAMQAQLSISAARELVSQYGGTLETRDAEEFSVVTIELPVAPRHADATRVVAPTIRTALVVEDEPMVLRRLCQLVARRGYEVMSASTVAEGMLRLREGPDLLITDLQLPDGSGEEIALASYEADPKRPIVVCSGFSAEDVRRGRLRDAPLTFLAKPFTTADFEAAIS
ncbi:MAG: response regulator [Kofleriaceae bacterium]